MKRVVLVILAYFFTLIPVFAFSEIDDIASIEAQSKGEYKKIDKDFYIKGVTILNQIKFSNEEKDLIENIYEKFKDEYYLEALALTEKISNTNDKKILTAIIYSALNMTNSAEELLKDIDNKELESYKADLKKENMYETNPYYAFLVQDLSEDYDLDYQSWGILNSKKIGDSKVKLNYKMIDYTSSNNVFEDSLVNYINLESSGHINPKIEYGAGISSKFFERDGKPLLLGHLWGKYAFNDNLDLKIGASRQSVEQSYISSVGTFINNNFTGRAARNEVVAEANFRIKKDYYGGIRLSGTLVNGYNLPDNWGYSAYINFGKRLYNNPQNPYIQKIDLDLTSYNFGYKNNLLTIYSPNGAEYGGYFSPKYYNSTTINIRLEGVYKRLSYGLKGFVGEQISTNDNKMTPAFGISPYLKYKINDRLYLKTTYTFSEFADIKSHLLTIGLFIKI